MRQIVYYKGKLIDGLSREELIEALGRSIGMYSNQLESNQIERRFWAEVTKPGPVSKPRPIALLEKLMGRDYHVG